MPKIEDLRITFVWIETFFDLLKSKNPDAYPLGFLSHGYSYKAQLKTLLALQNIPSGLALPWRKPAGDLFWMRYLGDRIPGHIKASMAWEKLVPLRGRPKVQLRPQSAKLKMYTESYFYPFGTALAVSVYLRDNMILEQAVEQAHQFLNDSDFEILPDKKPAQSGRLKSAARSCLDSIRAEAIGTHSQAGPTTIDPLTIATVVRGSDVDPSVPLNQNSHKNDIQRALEALANWQPNWKTLSLPALTDPGVTLDISNQKSSTGDVLYAGKGQIDRGRVIWFPGKFTLSKVHKSTLTCYHRNLVIATLHTESLIRFLHHTYQSNINHEYKNLPNFKWCVQKACLILSDLYNGIQTYRSGSIREQIGNSGYKASINALLSALGLSTLP